MEQGLGPVLATVSRPSIFQAARDSAGQAHLVIELTEQQDDPTGRGLATIETGGDLTAFTAWKGDGRRGTFCHGGCRG